MTYPVFRPVADHAVLVEFGEAINRAVHDEVLRLDARVSPDTVTGFLEAVPAYVNILIRFDPLITDHAAVEKALRRLIDASGTAPRTGQQQDVRICYDADFAPDLPGVAQAVGLSAEAVIAAHLAGDYRVYMYGFAPGYAYLAGVPEAIRLPRKTAPVRDVAAGSVVIAGPQCLVTTLVMPTGWWIIGRSPTQILNRGEGERPVLFDVGDTVRFTRIDRAAFEAEAVP
ncbi:5-oxoprolinase subunit B family protein [Teichococcus vastitatis]|uniref:5-oxoprolinase subunit B family protein n=1 Tax=Teichococcus vastitatis TaxID=2307076 RepID=UPI00192E737F|nr:allophanate hydrolase subunit 1 [Pseudoroseomonas vastitatis]